ncbi:MAG: TAXI family TRAP transporter solute-binding subunit [Gammaproteobacteria bacterium]|jgi:TRAP transporter TAXI family solute receptor
MIGVSLRPFAACLALSILISACGGSEDSAQSRLVTIGSNPAGTHVYAVAAGLARVLQENGGIRTTIRPFSGSSVYLPLMQRGEIGLGLNTSIDSYLSFTGSPPYDAPMSNLRMVAMIFPLPIMYMVRADSELRRVEDLRGRDVVIAFRANAALEQLHTGILATGGLTPQDVNPVVVAGLPEAMRMLTEGRADAVPTGLNTALALQVNATLPGGIRYLTMGADEARLPEIMPGALAVTIAPEDGDVGIAEPIRVAGVNDLLNTSVAMSADRIYIITRTIVESWDELRRDHAQISETTIQEAIPSEIVHPYHAGAVRYYREAGFWSPAHQRNQDRLLDALGVSQ